MLDFRPHRKAPTKLVSREQRRVVWLAAASAMVLLLIVKSGNPANWRWLAWDAPAIEAPPPADPSVDKATEPLAEQGRFFPGVSEAELREIKDDTVFRDAERDAWFHLLGILARTDPSRLAAGSLGRVGYLQLDQQSREYRGRLVTLGGVVRQAKRVSAPANEEGVAEYYQLWLQPDRASSALVVIYCLELPQGFPLGTGLDAAASTTGFFFKRWAYPSQGGITTAPLVLARTVTWKAPPPADSRAEEPRPLAVELLSAVAGALLLALAVLGFLLWRGRKRPPVAQPNEHRVATALALLERQSQDSTPATARGKEPFDG